MKTESYSDTPVHKKHRPKPKVEKEWAEADIFKLISLVEDEKCLWDSDDDAYHNRIIRERSWRRITQHFNLKYSPADLNAKWTNLRIQFRSYMARYKKPCDGQDAIKAPKWRFYSAMGFLVRSEDKQIKQNTSKTIYDSEEAYSNSPERATVSTPPLATQWEDPITLSPQQTANGDAVTATHMMETMREVIAVIKESRQNTFEPNTTFSNYLLSELKTLSNEAAASVRKRVTMFFLQCLEEERSKDAKGLDVP